MGANALMTSPHFHQLEALRLNYNQIQNLSPCRLPSLRHLALGRNPLTSSALDMFCAASILPCLDTLDLSFSVLSARAISALQSATGLPALRRLLLTGSLPDQGAVSQLLTGEGLPNLEELCLRDGAFTDSLLDALARSPLLTRLRQLSLYSGNRFSEAGLARFRELAWERGCSVDLFRPYRPNPLRALRMIAGGLAREERLELVRYLQRLRFQEYSRAVWFKIAATEELAAHAYERRAKRLLQAWLDGQRGEDCQHQALRSFSSWLAGTIPESIYGWDLDPGELRALSRPEALVVARELLAQNEGKIEGVRPVFAGVPGAREILPAGELATWFDWSFGPDASFFEGHQAVLGLDQAVVGMLWFG